MLLFSHSALLITQFFKFLTNSEVKRKHPKIKKKFIVAISYFEPLTEKLQKLKNVIRINLFLYTIHYSIY
jgi:hypothetical protein